MERRRLTSDWLLIMMHWMWPTRLESSKLHLPRTVQTNKHCDTTEGSCVLWQHSPCERQHPANSWALPSSGGSSFPSWPWVGRADCSTRGLCRARGCLGSCQHEVTPKSQISLHLPADLLCVAFSCSGCLGCVCDQCFGCPASLPCGAEQGWPQQNPVSGSDVTQVTCHTISPAYQLPAYAAGSLGILLLIQQWRLCGFFWHSLHVLAA